MPVFHVPLILPTPLRKGFLQLHRQAALLIYSLLPLVRNGASEEALAKHIERALQRKQERHDGIGMEQPERPMWRIGG